MWDFSFAKSLGMVLRSWPFVLLRAVAYTGVAIVYLVLMSLGGGIGYGVGHVFNSGDAPFSYGLIGGAIGFGVAMLLFRLVAQYLLYIIKAGHISILVELMDGRPVPAGFGQITHGRAVVTERFAEASSLFVLDQLIKGVVRAVTGILNGVGSLIPIPGLTGLISFFNAVVSVVVNYADEVILAYNIRSGVNEPWETSRRALVLYAQNGKPILKNAFWLALMIWGVSLVVFLAFLSPAAAFVYFMPGQMAGWSVVVAGVATAAFLAAFVEPFAIASLMQVYFKVIEGQQPQPEWDAKLEQVSRQFREIKDNAVASWGRSPQPRTPA